jgi:CheY-like chemotaxis protein
MDDALMAGQAVRGGGSLAVRRPRLYALPRTPSVRDASSTVPRICDDVARTWIRLDPYVTVRALGHWLGALPPSLKVPAGEPFLRGVVGARKRGGESAEDTGQAPHGERTQPRVLIVDDDVEVTFMLRRLFARAGFVVETAHSAADALEKLAPFAPDVIITDYVMPGMGGAELLREVRTRAPHVRRHVLTGNADAEPLRAALAEGTVQGISHKPWGPSFARELAALVRGRG